MNISLFNQQKTTFVSKAIKALFLVGMILSGCVITFVEDKTLTLSESALDIQSSNGQATFSIVSNTFWSVSSNANWLTVNKTSGSGDDEITVTVAANPTTADRTAIITVKVSNLPDQTITVVQKGQTPTLSLSTASLSFAAAGQQQSFTVTSNTAWTVSSNAPTWLTVSTASGTNNATVTVTAAANTAATARTATITISGTGVTAKTITVTQLGASATPELILSTNAISFTSASQQNTFTITSNTNWTVSSNAPTWLTVSPVSGSNNGTVTVTAAANTAATARTATITISGTGVTAKTITVTQTGTSSDPTLILSTQSISFPAAAQQQTFTITSNTAWTVSSSDPTWLTVSPASGANNGTVTVTAAANPYKTARNAIVTINGTGVTTRTISVTQVAGTTNPTLTVSPNTLNFAAEGQQQTFTITSNTSWTVSSSDPTWLTVSPVSGSNNGTVTVTASANTGASARTAAITVRGTSVRDETIIVTQAYTVSPSVTVHVDKPGTLCTLLGENRNEITDLTITGDLNGADQGCIRYMAGCDVNNNATLGKLTNLNLSGANMICGICDCAVGNSTGGLTTYPNELYLRCYVRGTPTSTAHQTNVNQSYYYFENSSGNYYYYFPYTNSISYQLFYRTNLTNIVIPNSVTGIGWESFSYCTSLTSVTIPNSVTSIGNETFRYCTSLTSVTIGNSVTSIGINAFSGCTKLATIHSKNPTPPTVQSNSFDTATKQSCKLYVPKGSSDAYRNSAWGQFVNIFEE